MFITEEEFRNLNVDKVNEILQRVCAKAAEEALRSLPMVMDNLLKQGTVIKKASEKFYTDHAEFLDHKEIVAATIEELDIKNPGRPYADNLADAVPLIRERIKIVGSIDINAKKPSLESLDKRVNGEL